MTYNLEKAKVAYINPDYILKHFQKEVEEVRFGYITCVFVSPKIRNLRFFNLLVEACINTIGERDYVLALDVSASRQFIPEALEILSKEYGYPLKKQLLGTQSYFAFRRSSESELREVDKADP
jgi:ribosomal protein S18 acetylase RimI-like enzyme